MKFAPFLLQAFAARVLATKDSATVARAELERQGYDVTTLVDMIEAYAALPDNQRGFTVTATETEITIRRKPGGSAPLAHVNSLAPTEANPRASAAPPAPPPARSERRSVWRQLHG